MQYQASSTKEEKLEEFNKLISNKLNQLLKSPVAQRVQQKFK